MRKISAPKPAKVKSTPAAPRADVFVSPLTVVTARVPDNPVALDRAQEALLAEALLQGERARDAVEDAVMEFGRWLLLHVFDNNAQAATDLRVRNPVFLELLRRAGGPTLGLSVRAIYVALHAAAYDRRIADATWRGLTLARKELLLPLGEEAQIRQAARHVAKFNLSHRDTRTYVSHLLTRAGTPRQVRVTLPRLAARMRDLRERSGAPVLERAAALARDASPEQRTEVLEEVRALRAVLGRIERALRRESPRR
jgi:hypothetical protein